ncbi:MAG: helix-turn-helix domain-containing protein [Patescibacteria group bacterium]
MRRRLHDLLRLAGLREEETALYALLLKKGRASVSELMAESGFNVMTAYRTVKRLRERGLVAAMKVNRKVSVYAPLTLGALVKKLDVEQRKMRKLQLALSGLDSLLPYADLSGSDEAEPVEVREGLEAFREEYLKLPEHCDGEYLHIGSMDNYWEIAGMSDESPEEIAFRRKRYKHGVFARVINTYSPVMVEVAKRDSREMRTLRISDDIPVKRDYIGFAKKYLAHFVCDRNNPRVILIRHPELLALHKRHYADLWKGGVGA